MGHPFGSLAILVFEPGVGTDYIQVSVAIEIGCSIGGDGAVNGRTDEMSDPGLPLPFIEIVGEAGKGDETMALFLRARPDAWVAAVCLPEHGGFHMLQSIKRAAADCAVILTTREANPFVAEVAALLGAAAVLPASEALFQLPEFLEGFRKAKWGSNGE